MTLPHCNLCPDFEDVVQYWCHLEGEREDHLNRAEIPTYEHALESLSDSQFA